MASHSDNASSSSEIDSLEKGTQSVSCEETTGKISKSQQDSSASPTTRPGVKAWLSLFGGVLGMFASFGWVNCVGLFQAEYELNQLKGYSSSDVSWIISVEWFFMLFFSLVSGRLFDSYGPRLPIAIGSFLHVLGLLTTSWSTKYYQFFLAQSVCSGIGASLIMMPSMTAPMTYFPDKRPMAGALAIAGSSLGGIIYPLMIKQLLPEIGFGWTMRTCALLILGLLLIVNFVISSNAVHVPKDFSIRQYLKPLEETNFSIMCVASFFMYWGLIVPYVFMVVSAIHYGMSASMAYNLIPILNAVSFFGRTLPVPLTKKYGQFNVLIIASALSVAVILGSWLPSRGNAAIIVFTVLFGFVSGTTIGLGPMLVVSISPPQEVGYRMGAVFAFSGIAALVGPPIAGAIISRSNGSYVYACVFSGASYLICTILLVVLKGRVAGWNLLKMA